MSAVFGVGSWGWEQVHSVTVGTVSPAGRWHPCVEDLGSSHASLSHVPSFPCHSLTWSSVNQGCQPFCPQALLQALLYLHPISGVLHSAGYCRVPQHHATIPSCFLFFPLDKLKGVILTRWVGVIVYECLELWSDSVEVWLCFEI